MSNTPFSSPGTQTTFELPEDAPAHVRALWDTFQAKMVRVHALFLDAARNLGAPGLTEKAAVARVALAEARVALDMFFPRYAESLPLERRNLTTLIAGATQALDDMEGLLQDLEAGKAERIIHKGDA
jgi:hypothetical protein